MTEKTAEYQATPLNVAVAKMRRDDNFKLQYPEKAEELERLSRLNAELLAALRRIADINNGPDKASGEWRCQEAESIARAALAKVASQP